MTAEVLVRMSPDGSTARVGLGGSYLGKDRFAKYLSAVSAVGGRYQADSKTNAVDPSMVPELLGLLQSSGFTYAVDEGLVRKYREDAQQTAQMADEGASHLARMEAAIAARGLSLYPFQRSGVKWTSARTAGLLCDEMGLGKTVQLLLALPEGAAALAVVPAAVASNWARETRVWRPDLTPVILKGKSGFRWPRPGEVCICTYGILPSPKDGTVPAPQGVVLMADEAHLLKNKKAARSTAFHGLRDSVFLNGGRVWLATGTPLLNRPPELWAVLEAANLAKPAFGSWPKFCAMFAGRVETIRVHGGYRKVMEWGSTVSDQAPLALQRVSLHRRRLDVLPDLPGKRRVTRILDELPAGAAQACQAVVDALAEKGIDIEHLPPGTDLGSLISGPVFQLMSRARAQLASAKLPLAIEIVEEYEEAEEPLVVVSAHREPVDVIGARPGWAAITGETPNAERGEIAARFQAGELKGVALTFAAGGVGITLTRGAHILMVDLPWTPALIQQAEDRCCRIGQTRGILITRLVAAHPLDERVDQLLVEKAELIEAAVESSAVSAGAEHEDVAANLAKAAEVIAAAVADIPAPPPVAKPEKRVFTAENIRVGCVDTFGNFRAPRSEREVGIARALLFLSAHDPDSAAERNDVGFSKFDSDFGHSLADNIRNHGRLSDRQWDAAAKLANKYRRQVAGLLVETEG